MLLNFFASWCVPCVQEHPALMALAGGRRCRSGPSPTRTRRTRRRLSCQRHGNPYQRIARDAPGRVAIDFGLSGVPESYLVDGSGVVRWHWANGLSADVIETQAAAGMARRSS